MNDDIKITPFGNMLEYKKGFSAEFVKNTITEKRLEGLRIHDDLDPLDSLDFLKDYIFLKKLHIQCIHDQDFSFLKKLPNLNSLSIGISVEMKNIIDLSNQINLNHLGITWRKGKVLGLEKCQSLLSIGISMYKEKDLRPFSQLVRLKKMVIASASIESLNELENINEIEELLLGYCKSLTSIKHLNGKENLKKIEIDCCTKIDDYESLVDLPNLEILEIKNCKGIKSIGFIKNIKSLKTLVLSESTDILDGDLKPALGIKIVYKHRKHYNVKIENKEQDALYLRNLKKLLEISIREGREDISKRILREIAKLER